MTTNTTRPLGRKNMPRQILLGLGIFLILALIILYYLMFINVTNRGLTFTNSLHIPPLLEPTEQDGTKVFELVAQHGQTEFLAGEMSDTMGYNGDYLGPTIRVEKGDDVIINVSNQLDEETATHWHGMHVPPEMDGTPHQLIPPGEIWQARYPILNEAATMWYHPHPHGTTAQQVYHGLAGFYIIDDANSQGLDLPKSYGIDDIPLVIQERSFDDGILTYGISNGASYGDSILINGTHNPFLQVPAKQIRLRILNGSNARFYIFGFDDGRQFHQIATDGGFLEAPVPLTRLKMAPGERAEIVVDLSDGNEALLKSFPDDNLLYVAESVVINGIGNGQFDLLKLAPDATGSVAAVQAPAALPPVLNQIVGWSEEEVDKVRTIRLAGGMAAGQPAAQAGGGGRAIPINGKLMDMARIDEVVTLGDVEIWEITNGGGVMHPFHIHDIQFLILDRDGVAPAPNEKGWKDTVLVDPGETVRFITQFTTYANPDVPFMYHCHILEHEDRGMMGQFLVIDPDSE